MGTVELEYAMKDWLEALQIWDIWVRDNDQISMGAYQYDESLHKIDINFWNMIQLAPRFNTTPLGMTTAVMAHELGHYIHYSKYNGLSMDAEIQRSPDEREIYVRTYRVEIRAYRFGLDFIPQEYLHVYELINTLNLNHYKKHAGIE
jgi:hypothetical protein